MYFVSKVKATDGTNSIQEDFHRNSSMKHEILCNKTPNAVQRDRRVQRVKLRGKRDWIFFLFLNSLHFRFN